MSKTYIYPNFRWYQFVQKRRWKKALSGLSPGERVKLRTDHFNRGLPTFTDDFTISWWVEIKESRKP